jgi:hypothetical protein
MPYVNVDAFNIICGIVTLVSFVVATVQYFIDRGFKKYAEAELQSLIGILDKTAAMEEEDRYQKSHMAVAAANARDQAIGLLRSFSRINQRLETYDFGIDGKDDGEKKRKRKEKLGVEIGGGGCVLCGQLVSLPIGQIQIDEIGIGDEVISADQELASRTSKVLSKSEHLVSEYLSLNEKLCVTANHSIYVRDQGWKSAGGAEVGEFLMKSNGQWEEIISIEKRTGQFRVVAMATEGRNYFVNGLLVHNEQK